MIVSPIHFAELRSGATLAGAGRLLRTVLCLAAVAAAVVALRHGLYEHFHGDGRTMTGLIDAIRR